MIVFFDTVRRKRPVREGGEVVKLDWETKRVLATRPVFPQNPDIIDDPNPRGNSRGGKGILVTPRELLVASYHTILVLDHDLNLLRSITHPLFVNIHEMAFEDDQVWVAATTIDAAVRVDSRGRTTAQIWPREDRLFQRQLGLFPMEIDKTADNRLMHLHSELGTRPGHLHLNSVIHHGGRTYAFLNRLGALIELQPQKRVVLHDDGLRGGHSPVILENGKRLLVCASFSRAILEFDLDSGRLVSTIDLTAFEPVRDWLALYPNQPFNHSIFVRGLDLTGNGRLLVGISPAAILEIDRKTRKLVDAFQYSRDVGDAVHGLVHCVSSSHD